MVASGTLSPQDRDLQNAADEETLRAALQKRQHAAAELPMPIGEHAIAKTVPVLPKPLIHEWLIGSPEGLLADWDQRDRLDQQWSQELEAKLLYLTSCGVPLKDTESVSGAARQCGITAGTVVRRMQADPAFAAKMRAAKDSSSEILEDEMRAMLPTALRHPEMVNSLRFVAERLEWLAKVRNRERYGEQAPKGASGSGVSFTINVGGQSRSLRPALEGEATDGKVAGSITSGDGKQWAVTDAVPMPDSSTVRLPVGKEDA
jgi:hypothetical protein